MFERFTDRARAVVVLAQDEARMLHHHYIGTEHVLLGLIHEGQGVAARTLESLGISLEAVRRQVEEIIGRGQLEPSGHIPFTPRAKKVLELSLREALQLGHNYIGTEHILLGLIREGEGVAAQVLVRLGADLNRVRQQVIYLLVEHKRANPDPPASAPEPAPPVPPPRDGSQVDSSSQLREAVRLAGEEARALRHGYIGTEHLLLGLLITQSASQAQAMVDEVRARVIEIVGIGEVDVAGADLTPEAADALDLARCRALAARADRVTAEDLFAALAWAPDSVARRVMTDLGQPVQVATAASTDGPP